MIRTANNMLTGVIVSPNSATMEQLTARLGLPIDTMLAIDSEANIAFGIVRYHQDIFAQRFRIGARLYHIMRKPRRLHSS